MNISKKELTSCFINAAARSFRAENYQTVVFLFYSFKFARLNNCFYQVSVSAFVCSFWLNYKKLPFLQEWCIAAKKVFTVCVDLFLFNILYIIHNNMLGQQYFYSQDSREFGQHSAGSIKAVFTIWPHLHVEIAGRICVCICRTHMYSNIAAWRSRKRYDWSNGET